MQTYQREFIQLAIKHEVLCFGEFTLKSGRISPYFFNAGKFYSGSALAALGRFYAQRLVNSQIDTDVIFGPAYKGISLAATTAATLAASHQRDYSFTYNRKEKKDHGEGGTLVGAPLEGKVVVVDDVITAGTAIGEAAELIRSSNAELAGVLIGLDRQERGQGALSAVQEVEQKYGIPVLSIITMSDIIDYLEAEGRGSDVEKMAIYRNNYGIEH